MSKETYTQVIQDILDLEASKKTFDDQRAELIWRMGYLTGMLGQIADNDYTIAHLLERYQEKLTAHKKKKS